ncbi:hypothetical protein D3C76_1224100 [compost metagenome]
METQPFADLQHQCIHCHIMFSLTTAWFIVVIAVAAFLAETAQFTQAVIYLYLRRILPHTR